MIQYLSENAAMLSAATSILMLLVWATYLNVFLVSFRRQTRSVVHLSQASATNETAICVLTNMGAQPIFILGLVIDLEFQDDEVRVCVTEREEYDRSEFEDPLQRTLEGTLQSGESRDIGSFEEIARRAAQRSGKAVSATRCHRMTLTAVAASNQTRSLIGGYKTFDVHRQSEGGGLHFRPRWHLTPQIGGLFRTRRLAAMLDDC